MRVELRVVVALGLALAIWLALVPTPDAAGAGCGLPLAQTQPSDEASTISHECAKRNQTRVTQATWTVALVGLAAGVEALIRREHPLKPKPAPPPTSRSHYE